MSEVQPDDHPDSTQRSDKEVHGTSLEDGEVHDASGRTSDAESGEVSDGAIAEDQQDAASPEATVKRKRQRGERAGKQVRRRQARRLRNIELGLLVHDGTRVGPGASKSKSDATKTAKPTCKYVTCCDVGLLNSSCSEVFMTVRNQGAATPAIPVLALLCKNLQCYFSFQTVLVPMMPPLHV